MPMTPQAFVPQEKKANLIKIYSYENQNPVGTVVNLYDNWEAPFENLTQLLFTLEARLDELNHPQKSMEPRRFDAPTQIEKISPREGGESRELACFKVEILFRQNASWQGSLAWMERGAQAQFRSVLEFVILLDSVLMGKV